MLFTYPCPGVHLSQSQYSTSSVSDVLFGFSPVCVFKCPFKSPALEEEKSCWLQWVDFSPVWVLNESSNSWSEMMYSYIGCTLHNWMRPTTSTKLYSSVSSITISLQFGVVWASFALCGPPRWGQLLRLLHHHPLLFGVVHGLALLYVGHHHVLQLQTQPLTLLNLCIFILQKNFHWGPNVSIWGDLKCSLGGSNVPIWGDLMCQFWGYQMCRDLVIHNLAKMGVTARRRYRI